MTTQTPTALLATLEALRRELAAHVAMSEKEYDTGYPQAHKALEDAQALMDAHETAHRDRDDDACPCYAQGWTAGHEAERRPV